MDYVEAGIPARLRGRSWADLKQTEGVNDVRSWIDGWPARWLYPTAMTEDVGRGLFLHGGTGSGKTTAAGLLARDVADSAHSVRFMPAPTLQRLLSEEIDLSTFVRKVEHLSDDTANRFETVKGTLAKLRRTHYVVVFDDWGRERLGSEWFNDYVEGLLRERYNRGLPTIITSNAGPKVLDEMLSRPFSSFLREACVFLDFGDEDRRAGW